MRGGAHISRRDMGARMSYTNGGEKILTRRRTPRPLKRKKFTADLLQESRLSRPTLRKKKGREKPLCIVDQQNIQEKGGGNGIASTARLMIRGRGSYEVGAERKGEKKKKKRKGF